MDAGDAATATTTTTANGNRPVGCILTAGRQQQTENNKRTAAICGRRGQTEQQGHNDNGT
jgi:hypothetical protein